MEHLPEEIINEILLKVDRPSLFQASQVNLLWRRLTLDQVVQINNLVQLTTAALKGDQLSIIKSPFDKGWINWGLYNACRGGHLELAQFMIDKGADNWNLGLEGACQGGHLQLVQFMIDKGANDWNYGLYGACFEGHLELAQLMMDKGANDLNRGLFVACERSHLELVRFMVDKGADKCHCGRSINAH